MDGDGVLTGKVVLVTGAGGGIGRACALLAAAEGASVVVNDLGVDVSGGGADAGPAHATAAEIRAAGGAAIANTGSVVSRVDADAMVRQAIDAFGGLHAVINPAGFLRDAMFHKMDEADWDAVVDVHLRGAFNVCRAAVGHFREQGEGAFVLFSSTSGLIGNVGQANYGAAKMGVAGLSRILALEGAMKGVRSNVVTPFAWTRMVGTIPLAGEGAEAFMAQMKQKMRPDQVAQLAVALASPATGTVSGQVFVTRGNEITLMSQPRPLASAVEPLGWTPRSIAARALPSMVDRFYPLKTHMEFFAGDAP